MSSHGGPNLQRLGGVQVKWSLFALLGLLSTSTPARAEGGELVFEAAASYGPGWMDYGWSPRSIVRGAPASVSLAGYGGWIVCKPGLTGDFGGVRFRYQAPASFGDFLNVALRAEGKGGFPDVPVNAAATTLLADGWREVKVPMSKLNPGQAAFDRIVFSARKDVSSELVHFDRIELLERGADEEESLATYSGPSRHVKAVIDCSKTHPISPLIYGVGAGYPGKGLAEQARELGATARRFGGNPTSRYNWRAGNAWNTASDWFYQNVSYGTPPGWTFESWLSEDRDHGLASAVTVPMLGWVAKDTSSASFPVSVYGKQQQVAPEAPNNGNGRAADGTLLEPGSPARTSVPMPPEGIERWVKEIRKADAKDGRRSVRQYILDNEPGLWNSTHRDVHPEPLTYDELLEKTIAYGQAVRRADPQATIAGPAEWGWSGYLYSAADLASKIRLDRLKHGNKPLLPWLLGELRAHELKTGEKLLDIVDVHYYPQFQNAGIHASGDVSPEGAARRIRSTRAFWDPTYKDESWIDEKVNLIPRLRGWIAENSPGLGISIGEWNFGAERHISGGLAVAEVLGHFGTEGVTSAFYWTLPEARSAAFWAFRAFRNYDGQGGRFLDTGVSGHAADAMTSVFASREPHKLVAVITNRAPESAGEVQIELRHCGSAASALTFAYAGGPRGLRALPPSPVEKDGASVRVRLLPSSILVLEAKLKDGRP